MFDNSENENRETVEKFEIWIQQRKARLLFGSDFMISEINSASKSRQNPHHLCVCPSGFNQFKPAFASAVCSRIIYYWRKEGKWRENNGARSQNQKKGETCPIQRRRSLSWNVNIRQKTPKRILFWGSRCLSSWKASIRSCWSSFWWIATSVTMFCHGLVTKSFTVEAFSRPPSKTTFANKIAPRMNAKEKFWSTLIYGVFKTSICI